MPSLQPGVTVREDLAVAQTTSSLTSTVSAMVAENPRGPVEPTRVTSWSQYVKWFGAFHDRLHELPFSVFLFFSNGGRQLFVSRPVGAGAEEAERGFDGDDGQGGSETKITVQAHNPGTWGNEIYVAISEGIEADTFNLHVLYGGNEPANRREVFQELSLDPAHDRFVENIVNSPRTGSTFVKVTAEENAGTPDVVTEGDSEALAGGSEGTAVTSTEYSDALDAYNVITNPVALALPGVSETNIITEAVQYAEGRGDVFVVVDPPKGLEPSAAISMAESIGDSSFAAMYYPRIRTADPSSMSRTADRIAAPSGAILGLYAMTDATRGVWKAPAGIETRISTAIGLEFALDGQDLEDLNTAHVNPLRHMPGAGITIHGARTLRKTRQADRYIPVRRTLVYLNKAMQDLFQFAVFEVNEERTWEAVRGVGEKFLREVWSSGGLRGETQTQAFYVKCDGELNDETAIEQGIMNVEIGVALQRPAEFIVISLRQWEGGASAVEIFAI